MEMELFRNMEVMLLLSFGLIVAAACIAQPPARPAARLPAQASVRPATAAAPMPVVVITGKRLSAAEKRALAGERA
jgi:hypothetical protein